MLLASRVIKKRSYVIAEIRLHDLCAICYDQDELESGGGGHVALEVALLVLQTGDRELVESHHRYLCCSERQACKICVRN